MIRPVALEPGEDVITLGRAFGTPIVVKGWTWLPLTQLVTWLILSWIGGKRQPERAITKRLGTGGLCMSVMLGSEWAHNLAHAAAANMTGKNMDALRITWGMPMVVYHQIADPNVSPDEHITRALGGPVINSILLALSVFLRLFTKPGSTSRSLADTGLGTNSFLIGAGLLPMPFFDGGAIMKWSLVKNGRTPSQADNLVRKANAGTGAILSIASIVALKKKQWFFGGLLGMLAGLSISVASGLLSEKPS
jgi:hypothetical protein